MSGSDDEDYVEHESGEDEEEEYFWAHPIGTLLSSAINNAACGDFATCGVAALPFPGLSIHPNPMTSGGEFQVALPLTLPQAVDQLKARCSVAADGGTPVWELSAAQFSIENPAFHISVSAVGIAWPVLCLTEESLIDFISGEVRSK